jgi:hypothetical protein
MMKNKFFYLILVFSFFFSFQASTQPLQINENEYFEKPGLNVMVFFDIYPEGHQGAVGIIQNGVRVATNGDLRLEPTPGQWQPIPKVGKRSVDRAKNEISVKLTYPDSSINRKGFNPVEYPDLYFTYKVRVVGEGNKVHVFVDLDKPLPSGWEKKVGFNFELFPAILFGKSWYMDQQSGIFPVQANGPMEKDVDGNWQAFPMATGKKLTIAPETAAQTMIIESKGQPLQLLDGRFYHNNGWFVVRSLVTPGKTTGAVEWTIDCNVLPNFLSKPVVHISQIGYHPDQQKIAVIEVDKNDPKVDKATLYRISEDGGLKEIRTAEPKKWGKFLRFNYYQFDFSDVKTPGVYQVKYAGNTTEPFRINNTVYDRHVWQPVIEYFLPVQMCHMRINEGYRVWHGLCHMDDALMAPVDTNHFDGYIQGHSTLTKFKPLDQVPGLNRGGWHDAGDYDLRVESQAGEVWILSQAVEQFHPEWDQTTIDQHNNLVEIHRPDGVPDTVQEVKHGAMLILAQFHNIGHTIRGTHEPDLRQYTHLGDGSTKTDNRIYDPKLGLHEVKGDYSGKPDDRWIFTTTNSSNQWSGIASLAAAADVLKGWDDAMAKDCLETAIKAWNDEKAHPTPSRAGRRGFGVSSPDAAGVLAASQGVVAGAPGSPNRNRPNAAANSGTENPPAPSDDDFDFRSFEKEQDWAAALELTIATKGAEPYKSRLKELFPQMITPQRIGARGWTAVRALPYLDAGAKEQMREAVKTYMAGLDKKLDATPFGVPPSLGTWGGAGAVMEMATRMYFLHKTFPDLVGPEYTLRAVNYILGTHPVSSTSYVAGVGTVSKTKTYSNNRGDNAYIPGAVIPGYIIIKPDFPECIDDFGFLWFEHEAVVAGSAGWVVAGNAADAIVKESK